jgi:hypothetical protein
MSCLSNPPIAIAYVLRGSLRAAASLPRGELSYTLFSLSSTAQQLPAVSCLHALRWGRYGSGELEEGKGDRK